MKSSKHNQVGNFEKLVGFTNAQGAVYNPGKASIKSAALQTLLTQAQGSIQAAYVSRTAYTNALNAREQIIDTVPRLATRIIGVLQASGVSPETLASCRAIKRRFHHPPAKVTASSSPAGGSAEGGQNGETVSKSMSHADVESLIANLQQLVIMATADPLYGPNEAELQGTGLNTFVATLKERNKAVATAKTALNEANRTVHSLLYTNAGIYGQASATKAYIKSVFGYGSSKFKEVSAFKFQKRA